MKKSSPYRLLNRIEKYHYDLNRLKLYSNFIIAFKFNREISDELIESCLVSLISKRLHLRLNVFDIKNQVYCSEIHDLSIESILEHDDDDDDESLSFMERLNKYHSYRFKTNTFATLWKLIVCKDGWFFMLFDHSLYDGTTGITIVKEFISLLNNIPIPKDLIDYYNEFNKLTKPTFPYTFKFMIHSIWNKITHPNGYKSVQDGLNTFETHKVLIKIPIKRFNYIKYQLKLHDVTFTSFLTFVIMVTLANITSYSKINGSIAINLRRYIAAQSQAQVKNSYGIYVTTKFLKFQTKQKISLSSINDELSNEELYKSRQLVGMLKFINSYKYLLKTSKLNKKFMFEVSNLGYQEDFQNDKFSPLDYIFSQPSSKVGPFITHDLISTNENVNVLLSCHEFEKELFDEYVKDLKHLLLAENIS